MTRHHLSATLGLIAMTGASLATPTVSEWNVNDTLKWGFTVSGSAVTITITDDDADTFSFEAYDNVTGDPVNIDSITVASGVGGTVRVSVLPDPMSGRWHCRTMKTVRVPLFCEQCFGRAKDHANGA